MAAETRGHQLLPHTADAGIMAMASTLPSLFEEAATSLAELTAEFGPGARASRWEDVVLESDDLTALVYAWLNELIALADVHHGVVVATRVIRLDGPESIHTSGPWRLRARVGLGADGQPGILLLRQPKSATYHRLIVERTGLCWTMRAYLDL
jgi:SHS2 domain-containing protein